MIIISRSCVFYLHLMVLQHTCAEIKTLAIHVMFHVPHLMEQSCITVIIVTSFIPGFTESYLGVLHVGLPLQNTSHTEGGCCQSVLYVYTQLLVVQKSCLWSCVPGQRVCVLEHTAAPTIAMASQHE